MRLPFVRGFFQLFSLLILGFEALKYSVDVLDDEESGDNGWVFVASALVAVIFTILFFFILPLFLAQIASKYFLFLNNPFWFNFYEGVVRVVLFILYLFSISLLSDIKRFFEYHGAEHKVIAAYENGDELTPERVEKYSRFHPRCGTSFLILVVLISIVFFSLIRPEHLLGKVLLRIVAFPVLAGFIYELLKLEKIKFCHFIFYPGLLLQRITTREPNREQLEVAIKAFESLSK
ncbi:MAG: DUF1385 domain-containing protein [bacterium]